MGCLRWAGRARFCPVWGAAGAGSASPQSFTVFADTGVLPSRTLGCPQRHLCSRWHWLLCSICLPSLFLVPCFWPSLYSTHLTFQTQDPWYRFLPPSHPAIGLSLIFWLSKCWFFFFPQKLRTLACYPHLHLWIILPISVFPTHRLLSNSSCHFLCSVIHLSLPWASVFQFSFSPYPVLVLLHWICFTFSCTDSWCQQEYHYGCKWDKVLPLEFTYWGNPVYFQIRRSFEHF